MNEFAKEVNEDPENVSEGFNFSYKDLNMDKVKWMQYKEWYSIRIRHIKKVIDQHIKHFRQFLENKQREIQKQHYH